MNDEDLMNIVNEVFEEIEKILSKKWAANHRTKINGYLMTVTATVIAVRTLQTVVKKL